MHNEQWVHPAIIAELLHCDRTTVVRYLASKFYKKPQKKPGKSKKLSDRTRREIVKLAVIHGQFHFTNMQTLKLSVGFCTLQIVLKETQNIAYVKGKQGVALTEKTQKM